MDFLIQDLNYKKQPPTNRPPLQGQNHHANTNISSNPRAFTHSPQQPKVFNNQSQNANYRGTSKQNQATNGRVLPPPRQPTQTPNQYSRPLSYNNAPKFPPPNSNTNNYQNQDAHRFQNQSQPNYQRRGFQQRGNYQGYQGGRNNYNNQQEHSQSPNEQYGGRNDSRFPNSFNTRGNVRGRGRGGRGGRPYQPQENTYEEQLKEFVQKNFANNPYVRDMINPRGRGRGRDRGGGKQPQTRYIQKPKNSDNDQQSKNRRQKFASNYSKKPVQKKTPQNQKDFIKDSQSREQQANSSSQEQQESYYSDDQNRQQQEGKDFQDDDQENEEQSYDHQQQPERNISDQENAQYSQDQSYGQDEQNQQAEMGLEEKDSVQLSPQQKKRQKKIKSPLKAMKKLPQINYPSSSRCIDDMCSKQEYEDRIQTFNGNNRDSDSTKLKLDTSRSFSVFEINKRTMRPDYSLTLKRFRRSADRAQEGVVQDTRDLRRSIKALNKVIIHIGRQILDADHMNKKDLAFPLPPGQQQFQFIHIYDFLWDRMREMIKDITRLSQKQQITKEIITISQQIARFFILGINQGRKKYKSRLQFDQKMNRQSIVKILTILKQFYHNSRMELKKIILQNDLTSENVKPGQIENLIKQNNIYISPNQPQIISYVFLFSNDRKKEFYEILSVGQSSKNPLFQSQQIQKALQVHKFLNQKNYQQYFQYLQSESIDYTMSCLMLHHLNSVRKQAVKVLFKTHSKNSICTQELRQILRFKDKQKKQFQVFLSFLQVQKKQDMLTCNNPQFMDNVKVYKTPQYIFNTNKLKRTLFTAKNTPKPIINKNLISRQEIVTRSWRISTYDKQIIAFYLGGSYDPDLHVDVRNFSNAPEYQNQLQQQQQASSEMTPEEDQVVIKIKQKPIKSDKKNNNQKIVPKIESTTTSSLQKGQPLSQLQQIQKARLNMQNMKKNKKRAEFLNKFQEQVKELFRQTDKGRMLKQKKSIAVMDEWIMYYHDKMLKTALQKIQYQFRKKVLIQSVFEQILTFKNKKKSFFSKINRCPYEMDPKIYVQNWGERQILPLGEQSMSKKLNKLKVEQNQFAKCTNFEQALRSFQIVLNPSNVYNIFIVSTISTSNQNSKILSNIINYFISKSEKLNELDKSRVFSMVEKMNKDKKNTVIEQQFCIVDYKTKVNIKLVKAIDLNSNTNKGRKNNTSSNTKQQSLLGYYHLISHFFGCNSMIILKDNSKPQAVNPIIKIIEDFQNKSSRVQVSDKYFQSKSNTLYKKLKFNQLPILLVNVVKSSPGQNKIKLISRSSQLQVMLNLDEINVSELIQSDNLSHFLKNSLTNNLQKSVIYTSQSPLSKNIHEQSNMQVLSLSLLLRQIKVNAGGVVEKMRNYYGDLPQNLQKVNTFVFYQEYFNMCVQQLLGSIFWCFQNSKYQKKWPNYLNQLQNRQQVELDQQTTINMISETYYEMEFIQSICQKLKMNFVGPDSQKLDKDYLRDNYNLMNKKNNTSFSSISVLQNNQKKKASYEAMQNLVRLHQMIRMITDYINQFQIDKTLLDDQKSQTLISIFSSYDLRPNVYQTRRKVKINCYQQQQQYEYLQNSHLTGNSLQLFNFIITCVVQNVSFLNVIVPANFKFSLNSQEFQKRVKNKIGRQVRQKQYAFGILPGVTGKQNIAQKLIKRYNQAYQPEVLASRFGPYLPQIEYIQPLAQRNFKSRQAEQQFCQKKRKTSSIQNIPFQKSSQKSSFSFDKNKSKYHKPTKYEQFEGSQVKKRPGPIIDIEQLEYKKSRQLQKSMQNLLNSYDDHRQYIKHQASTCGRQFGAEYRKTPYKSNPNYTPRDYVRKQLLDQIRKKIKFST